VKTDSRLYHMARESVGLLRRDHSPVVQNHRRTTLGSGPQDFLGSLSPKVRKNQKWQAKKISQDFCGNVRVCCLQSSNDLQRLFSDVEDVAKKTYQRALGVGFQDNSETRQRFALEARKGWLRAYVLYIEDKPSAFWIGTLYRSKFYSNYMGYNPDYAKYSPGMYLILKTIADLATQKDGNHVAQIDWGLGDAQYKVVLGDCVWPEASVYIFAPTIRGLLLNAFRTPVALADRTMKELLNRSNMLSRIKRFWRNRVKKELPGDPQAIEPKPINRSAG